MNHCGHPQCWAYDTWQPTRQTPGKRWGSCIPGGNMIFPNPECQAYWDGWRDHQAPYTKWIQHERTGARSLESYHQKAQERRELVRRQQNLKLESCRAKGCIR